MESALGEGSIFKFTLPTPEAAPLAPEESTEVSARSMQLDGVA